MSVYKDKKYNTWRVVYRYVDWTGKMKQCQKRGFKNKRDAVKWEKETLDRLNGNTDMTFASFVERYTEDMKPRLKENTSSVLSFSPTLASGSCLRSSLRTFSAGRMS